MQVLQISTQQNCEGITCQSFAAVVTPVAALRTGDADEGISMPLPQCYAAEPHPNQLQASHDLGFLSDCFQGMISVDGTNRLHLQRRFLKLLQIRFCRLRRVPKYTPKPNPKP